MKHIGIIALCMMMVSCSQVTTLTYPGSDISYKIDVSGDKMNITPSGLSISNEVRTHNIEGYKISSMKTADLNKDGYPEVYVILRSTDSVDRTSLIAYSPNNGKSISEIYLPPIENSAEISNGYSGQDELVVEGDRLTQSFRIESTGKTRQVQYELVQEEAGWKFIVDSVTDF